MQTSTELFEKQFLEMRWRVLSLAADFDRLDRATGGVAALAAQPRFRELREAIHVLTDAKLTLRAEHVQQIFSDHSPAPARSQS